MRKMDKDYFYSMAFSHMVYMDYEGIDVDKFIITRSYRHLGDSRYIVEEYDSIFEALKCVVGTNYEVNIDYRLNGGYLNILCVKHDIYSQDTTIRVPNKHELYYRGKETCTTINSTKFNKLNNIKKLVNKL